MTTHRKPQYHFLPTDDPEEAVQVLRAAAKAAAHQPPSAGQDVNQDASGSS